MPIRIRLPSKARLRAILLQRCPNCLEGHVFSGLIRMRERCTLCGHEFTREQGYFQGAMYLSYGLSLAFLMITTIIAMILIPSHSEWLALAVTVPVFLVLVPTFFRYSRIIWMHVFYGAF